jgi:hypothetical protein
MVRSWPDLAKMANRLDRAKMVDIYADLDESGGVRPDLTGSRQTCSLESGNGGLPDSTASCWTLIFAFRNFFIRAKRHKIFLRKSFFLKIFYDVNHHSIS